MPKIVISYRRQDTEAITGRIRDRLASHYGAESVFMDIDSIPLGTDFREHIRQVLTTTDIVIAVMGARWTGSVRGRSARIRELTDPVRIEIERALDHGTPLVPVLVNGAHMPKPEELPDTLQDLSFRNAAEVDSGRDFHQHMDRLIRSLDQILASRQVPDRSAEAAATEEPTAPADRGGSAPERTEVHAAPPPAERPADPMPTETPVAAPPLNIVTAPRPLEPAGPVRRGGALLWILLAAAAVVGVMALAGVLLYVHPWGATPVAEKPEVVSPPEPKPATAAIDTSCKRTATAFFDDFKSPDGGWGQAGDTKFFRDNRMIVHPKPGAATSWLYFPLLYKKNIVVCSEVTSPPEIVSEDANAAGGVMFWATDYDNYYVAEIYTNGTYSVWRRLAGKWIAVVPRRPASSLRAGPNAVNQLKIAAGSREATLSINGTRIVGFWGQPPGRGGAVGLFGQSEKDAASEWKFASIAVVEDKQETRAAPGPHDAFANSCQENAAVEFVDEFSTPDPGWGASNDSHFFKDGRMVLQPSRNSGVSWIFSPLVFERGVVCAEVKSPSTVKTPDGGAKGGVVFWASDSRNFYVAQLYVDGSYAIYRNIDGRWAAVLPRAKAAAIHAGEDAVNRVKVAFAGHTAIFTVNDSTVARLTRGQPPPAGGSVGLYAEAETDAENQWNFVRIAVMEDNRPAPAAASTGAASVAAACKAASPAIFTDDFTAPDPGWGKSASDYYFGGGQMVLQPKADTNVAWIYTPLVFTGSTVCAEVKYPTQVKNVQGIGCAGIIFWAADYQNYYLAAIFTDGTYTIRRKIEGKWFTVVARSRADSIRPGADAVNQMMITTAAARAALYINDTRIVGFWGQAPGKGGASGLYGQSEVEQDDQWRFLNIAVADHPQAETGFPPAARDAANACDPKASPAFFDDFTMPDPGWGPANPTISIRDGRMVLKPKPSTIEAAIYLPLMFSTASVCADITFPAQAGETPGAAAGGIIFWASDYRNYHVVQIYPDGTYSVWRKIDGEWATVIPRATASAIHQGPGAGNRLKIVLDHTAVTVVINDATVTTFHGQPRNAGGAVGLYAGSGKASESEWRFANLVVAD
jgi:TIR domain